MTQPFIRKVVFDSSGNVLPTSHLTFDLGSNEKRFKDIYLSGNTIDLGGTKITKDESSGGITIQDTSGSTLDAKFNNLEISGNVIGNLIPNSNLVYDLGSADRRWNDLYLAGNSIDLSGTILSRHTDGSFMVHDSSSNMINGRFNDVISSGNVTVGNNLIVNGTTVTINSTTVTVSDPIITLGSDTSDNKDRGIEFRYNDGSNKRGFFGFDDSTGNFIFLKDATNTNEVFSGTSGVLIGDISGNASTVTNGVYTVGNQTIGGVKTFSGNLGIGKSPSAPLDVSGNSGTLARFTDGNHVFYFGCDQFQPWFGTLTNSDIRVVTYGSEKMRIDTSGNVGIGSANPQEKLDVNGSILSKFIKVQQTGVNSYINIRTNTSISGFDLVSEVTTNNAYIILRDNANMIFRTNNIERMRIDTSGNINFTGDLLKNSSTYSPANLTMHDTRNDNTNPIDLPVTLRADFKLNTTNGLNETGTYNVVLSMKHLSGIVNQLGLTENNNLWLRSGGNTTWNAWKRVMATDGGDFSANIRVGNANGYTIVATPVPGAGYYTYMSIGGGTGGYCYWFKNDANRTTDGGARTATFRNDDGDLRLLSSSSTGIRISGGIAYHENGNSSYSIYGPNTTYGAYLRVGTLYTTVDSVTANVISSNGNLHLDSGSGKSLYANYYSGGTVLKPGGGSWGDTSDLRIKKEITDIPNALDKLTSLRGVQFKWLYPQHHQQQENVQYGFIAQEFEEVFPQSVKNVTALNDEEKELCPDGVKTLGINFDFHAYTVEAIRELYLEQVKPLQEKIKNLEDRIAALERR
jgi:hypothetical protein